MEYITDPKAIERKSMEIISELIGELGVTPEEEKIIKRVVHTTGDPDYAKLVEIHPEATASGLAALKQGCKLFTDVNMVKMGINSNRLASLGGEVLCYINHPEVIAEAEQTGKTRAMTAMAKVARELDGNILAIGNAPTALFAVLEAVQEPQSPKRPWPNQACPTLPSGEPRAGAPSPFRLSTPCSTCFS